MHTIFQPVNFLLLFFDDLLQLLNLLLMGQLIFVYIIVQCCQYSGQFVDNAQVVDILHRVILSNVIIVYKMKLLISLRKWIQFMIGFKQMICHRGIQLKLLVSIVYNNKAKKHSTIEQMTHFKRQRQDTYAYRQGPQQLQFDPEQILKSHPNQLFNILQNIIARNTYKDMTPLQQIRIVALAGYVHPVMVKDVQHWLQAIIGSKSYWKISNNSLAQLEILNIIALITGLNYKVLNLQSPPQLNPQTLEGALFINAVATFAHGQYFKERKSIGAEVREEAIVQVRAFINKLIALKNTISKLIYSQESSELQRSSGKNGKKNRYHELDLQLAQHKIVTVNYLPEDYQEEFIQIWLDRTVELNSLLGNFVCKEKFGEFQYIRGPLTYAMQQGITALFNNFNQISNQLLVSIVSLARQGQITHNQKTIKASPGFKIIGILSGHKDNKSKVNINKLIRHIQLPIKNIESELPYIENETNRQFFANLFKQNWKELGYLNSVKLWKRIVRLRKQLVNNQSDTFSEEQKSSRLWNSYFTQQFIDDIQLEINDLTNRSNPSRIITYQQKYKRLSIGRTQISYDCQPTSKIVKTQYSLAILEKLNICFQLQEYPLLISQTGCGKTTLVQYLSQLSGHKLYVYNMSSGTDVTDLIGGFKPVDCRLLLKDLFYGFLQKFREEVPGADKNENYLINLNNYYIQGKIQVLLKSLVQSIPKIIQQLKTSDSNLYEWKEMMRKFSNILENLDKIDSNLVFSFLQGNLIKALKNGDWILIDEINLATNDVLQKIIPLIEGKSLMLYEKGDLNYIQRHKDFRIVACMNPANDSGKKPLPPNLAQKFTSIIMSEPSKADIEMMTKQICPQLNEYEISSLYFQIKKIKTVSLRNLSRALAYINRNKQVYGWNRSVYDGLMLGFGQKQLLKGYFNESVPKATPNYIEISGFLLAKGNYQEPNAEIFHLTETFKAHLKDLLRAIAGTELPVLLEGPTSAGKTSMIRYVADTVGYKCIRINNHQHTEIEEYIGNYFPDKNGKLVFREGPLVTAVKEGYWLILDELNLAKTQILECLNRLLDDNRELFIPEQQKHIKPHANFRIFATQNPSSYSGRKTLSRAFRNRFVSISFADINTDDTMAILQARSPLLKDSKQLSNFVKKTLESLSNYRQRQRVFEKQGLITIRNLLKWCERPFITKQKFIMEGYAILAEKLRSEEEKKFVEKALLSAAKLTLTDIKREYFSIVQSQFCQQKIALTNIYVQMNDSFKRMAALTIKAINNRQPVLLVGETGCGKTTLAELIAALSKRPFFSINCHKHMEASDLLGSLRPSAKPTSDLKFQFINGVVIEAMLQGGILLIDEINTAEDSVLERLNQVLQCGVVGIERGEGWQTMQARPGFCIIATMNPSGDYGKKQLSPALRNRFTEIWVEPITHPEYIRSAESDILKMITHKLHLPSQILPTLSHKIYEFLIHYNCIVAPRYNLTRKLMTMRDIGWICKFINDSSFSSWEERYFWGITILAIEGIKYLMTDNVQGSKLENMKEQLLDYLKNQVDAKEEWIRNTQPENIVDLLKDMNFPLLIKTDVPIQVLGIKPQSELFFSPQTDLSDLLGQYRPHGNDFVWHDQPLLQRVKEGGVVALIDLNMAQQQVVEGVNSLFDHRGSLFVVQLNQTFYKAATFKGIVVLRKQGGNGRKGLANSFLNRFVKIYIPEVSYQRQLNYLIQKYPHLANQIYLKDLILRLLSQQKQLVIEHYEFIIQFYQAGLLNQALEILNLETYIDAAIMNRYPAYQSAILQVLPFPASFQLTTPQAIKLAIQNYLVYKYSTFSVCLIGPSSLRLSIVKALCYLTNKTITNILISTMLDVNDLLGTYEQISTEPQAQQNNIFQNVFLSQAKEEYKSEETRFVFVQSRIVKSLKEEENVVYVQVPNETIAERIQKGLAEVYRHQKKIMMGVDSLNSKKASLNKFVNLSLESLTNNQGSSQTYEYFPSNETNLHHCDSSLRRSETESMITEFIDQENDRGAVSAWRRVIDRVINNSSVWENKNKEEVREKLIRQHIQRYGVQYIKDIEKQELTNKIQSLVVVSSNKQELMAKITLQCFFTSNQNDLSKKLILLGSSEQELADAISKFQVLYLCDVNNFRQTSQTILPMLFRSQSKDLIGKYFKEVQRLYEELFRFKIKEILIEFSEQEHKLVPIMANQETVRYLMAQGPVDIRIICDEGVHVDHVLAGVQRVVVENVKYHQVDIAAVSQWSRDAKIKHFGAIGILKQNLNKRNHLLRNPLLQPSVKDFLKEINLSYLLQSKNQLEQGLCLFDIFRPHENMSINLSYHLKNQLNLKFFNQLISNDHLYLQKYMKLSDIKYSGYQPSDLKDISSKIEVYKTQVRSLSKLLVYRGHDNIQNLIDFYQQLYKYSQRIIQSDYDLPTISKTIVETYYSHYHIYNDILMPYYLSLMVIYYSKYQASEERKPSIAKIIQKSKPNVVELIEKMIEKEEGEVDRSKDYLRFQKKFNKNVIVDEYTEEGVEKNKEILEQEFRQLFGKHTDSKTAVEGSPFEQMHMLINKTKQNYYRYLSQCLFKRSHTYQQLVCGLQILMKYQQSKINIYEEYNPALVQQLVSPIPAILMQIHHLINLYPIDNIKNLANLCNKIQERSLYDEVYKILTDCEYLIERIFEVNPILPIANHIHTHLLVQNCLRIRKMELNNWKEMMQLKLRRTQKSDMIEFLALYKNIKQVQNQKELFLVCERYLRESKLSCINNRIKLLLFLQRESIIPQSLPFKNSLFRVIGFYQYLMPEVNKSINSSRRLKEQQMREYQKLAGWNSNEFLIFKATCEKFQRKIHHILRRHDEELSITVGNYHQEILAAQFYPSIKEFKTGLITLLENKDEVQDIPEEKYDEEDNESNSSKQEQKQKEKAQKQQVPQEAKMDEQSDPDIYEQIVKRIFTSLNELQQEHHNTQSKLLIIRAYLSQLQDTFADFTLTANIQYKFITREMFESDEAFRKGCKYYYGLWDKLCQRAQTKWNREMIDRLWHLTQKLWVHINLTLKYSPPAYANQLSQDLRIIAEEFINKENKTYHPLFAEELQNIKAFLSEIEQNEAVKPKPEIILGKEVVSLIKLGYILANITVNLQKNGLCAKEEAEENQESGSEEVGDGMGIGEGQAHSAAENVGDEIEFQQQVMGHKDEEKNEKDNAGNKEENDIEMENDFEGQMYSKQEQQEGGSDEEGKSQEADEKMGEVDEKQKEKDMKNEAGQAEGSEEADVDVKDQKEGDEELIDNEREEKQARKGQEKRDMEEQEEGEEEEKSDWDQNNEEGEKINKQKEDVEAQEQESSLEMDQKEPQEIEEQGDVSSGNEEENQEEEADEENQMQENLSELQKMEDENENANGQGSEIEQEPQDLEKEEKPKDKKGKQSKKYNPAYGRRDINTNNEVLNDEENPANEAGEQGNDQRGEQEGNQGSGNPIHNLSAQFLQQVLKQQRSQGNQQFIRDLNVLMNDKNEELPEGDEENAQQFQMTEQKDKFATNLPLMDDQKMKNEDEEQLQEKKEEKRNSDENRQEEKKQGENNQKSNKQQKDDKQKQSKEQSKANDNKEKVEAVTSADRLNQTNLAKERVKQQFKHEKDGIMLDEYHQQIVRNALSGLKDKMKTQNNSDNKNESQILGEAFEVSKILEEQLKSVLQPMDNAEYRGDFKTGKKLNLKKIIPFIASNYRKDRIWLRRTEPSQRNYYVMIALDDTKSMHYGQVGTEALKGTLAISMALQHLSIKTSICSIRDEMVMLKNFGELLNSPNILKSFQFEYESSNSHDLSMASFMNSSLEVFKKVEEEDINIEVKKLCFIISDGKMNKKLVTPFMKDAKKEDITYIFIIVDSQQSSILSIKSIEYVDKKMKIKNYMSDFPFEYFLIINDVKELGQILAMTLMQFIQEK